MKAFKQIALAAVLAAAVPAGAQVNVLIQGYDFNQFSANAFPLIGQSLVTSIENSHSDIGQSGWLSFADFGAGSFFPAENAAFGSNGTPSVNRLINSDARLDPDNLLFNIHFETTVDSSALAFVSTATTDVSGKSFVIDLATTGWGDIVLTFAASAQTGAPTSIEWFYNTGSGNVATGVTSAIAAGGETSFAVSTVDLSSIDALENQASLQLVGVLGPGTVGNMLTLDNMQIMANAVIPEPGSYAALFGALALAGVIIRRRIRK